MNSLTGPFQIFSSMLKKYQIHLIAWAVFIFWESVIIGLIYGQFGNFSNYAIHYTLNISIFYVHAHVLMLSLKNPKQAFWKLPVFMFLETIFFVGLIYGVDTLLFKYTHVFSKEMGEPLTRALTVLWRCLFFMFFGTGYYFLISFINTKAEKERIERQRFRILLEKEKTEKELVQSRNAFLKAQINPHLLFNTLEFVYQKFKHHSQKDAEAMLYLADIMRMLPPPMIRANTSIWARRLRNAQI
ncbi:histidine kinase [Pedobacter jejuensis]|uniref:Histidine kinase n=1 Tax=Pedobacter jejuensis TaxID=1268550 RepID=A0A3N0BY38_9SPHI|nr:sensor histidine kinase [Pedobacter jejuensis]RNL54172.1 histidine kinase [Pedobacter jejuensis]